MDPADASFAQTSTGRRVGLDDATMDFDGPSPAVRALPARLGRYHVLERIGAGGMGVVLAAYDPDLDRKVALKLLRDDSSPFGSPVRLLREAQALARLSHPNVVQIYDAGMVDGQVFIAMEFVRGQDLRTWLKGQKRSPAEIVRVFLEAGRGLAAAHDAGLVHRDIKPDNLLVGVDGRVRVADFGLAREGDSSIEDGDPAPPREGPLALSLTRAGALLGTPAYMSPEQHLGHTVDARSDQFSFCVALWEALYGRRPFVGENPTTAAEAVLGGQIGEPGEAAPRRYAEVLRRGLARQPEERWPSMHALLAALARDPRRARRTRLGAVALVAALGAAAFAALLSRDPEAGVCNGAAEELAAAWGPERRSAVAAALEGARDPDVPVRALAGLDRFAATWQQAHRDACLDHHRGEQSATLLDARMRCLAGRRAALASAATVLAEGGADQDAAQVVARLPAIATCSDVEAVLAAAPPPDDPALAREAAQIDARLSDARARHHAGDLATAMARAREAAEAARSAGLDGSRAEALLVLGQTAMTAYEWKVAREALTEAGPLALAARRDEVAAEALARALYIAGVHDGERDAARAALPIAEAVARRLPEPHEALARLFNNRGAIALAERDREAAHRDFVRALDTLQRAPVVDPIDLALYRNNTAVSDPDPAVRSETLRAATEALEATLGPNHRLALELRLSQAHYDPDPAVGARVLAATCPLLATYYPDEASTCVRCFYTQGQHEHLLGRQADAAASFARALACPERGAVTQGAAAQSAFFRSKAAAFLALLDERPADAVAHAESGRASVWPYRHLPHAAAELPEFGLVRGRALAALGRADEARAVLTDVEAELARTVDRELLTLPRLLLAASRDALASLPPATDAHETVSHGTAPETVRAPPLRPGVPL
ncbi:Serine/threonine protein kinase [Nannocystis exedens]|uniref:Serine/threonine protein kinase n=1 Tax=Nannocystis exedens TaxID=54 RepID=A0A1I1YRD2_9BACT|nr:serine/threonine-protein kinase [Nannocystis exedens]PCC70195.1 serine/threonine protein kinase [Nannocystis exedens]SFE22051.1 Serine/threonine protein kinase [Nannocystis exedens]